METTWKDIGNSTRWRGVVSFIRNWVGPFESEQGMEPEALDLLLRAINLALPAAMREWYLLAANWSQGGLNDWIHPQELFVCDGIIWFLTDIHGITDYGLRVSDFDIEDPPVVFNDTSYDTVCQRFSNFVAAMIVNDVIFGDGSEDPIELTNYSDGAEQMRLISSCNGNFLADAPLDTATVVMFAYPKNGPVYGKSRSSAGSALLQRFR